MMTYNEFLKLVLRTGPYILANPEISKCPIPEEMDRNSKKAHREGGLGFCWGGVKTLGDLARLWENLKKYPSCESCSGKQLIVGAGGSPCSSIGKHINWYCPKCDKFSREVPKCEAIGVLYSVRESRAKSTFIIPNDICAINFDRIDNLFNGKLKEQYISNALEKLVEIDKMISESIAENLQFPLNFYLQIGENIGEVSFKKRIHLSPNGGMAEVYANPKKRDNFGGSEQLDGKVEVQLKSIPVEYDPVFGIWNTIYNAKRALEKHFNIDPMQSTTNPDNEQIEEKRIDAYEFFGIEK